MIYKQLLVTAAAISGCGIASAQALQATHSAVSTSLVSGGMGGVDASDASEKGALQPAPASTAPSLQAGPIFTLIREQAVTAT